MSIRSDLAEFLAANQALQDLSHRMDVAGQHEETDEWRAANRRAHDAEQRLPRWLAPLAEWKSADLWKRLEERRTD